MVDTPLPEPDIEEAESILIGSVRTPHLLNEMFLAYAIPPLLFSYPQ